MTNRDHILCVPSCYAECVGKCNEIGDGKCRNESHGKYQADEDQPDG